MVAFNVGHWPASRVDEVRQLSYSARMVRVMNWLRSYTFAGSRMMTEADDWQYHGGAWSEWCGHVPLSVCADIVRQAEALYVNLPYALDDDGIRSAVQELARLWPGAAVVTVGCEVWNAAGPYSRQRQWMAERGNGDALAGYAQRLIVLRRAVEEVKREDFHVVAECHTMNAGVASAMLRHVPGVAIAIAPYVGRARVTAETTLEQVHRLVWDDLRGGVASGVASHAELATRAGVPLLSYEAGHHLVGECPALAAYIDNGAMAQAYGELARVWAGVTGWPLVWYRAGSADGRGEWWDVGRIGR